MDKKLFEEMLEKAVTKDEVDTVEIKRGQVKKPLSYLSWSKAYKIAMIHDPCMKFEIHESDGFPCFEKWGMLFVKTSVTMFEETKSMVLPVMDNKHNSKHLTPYEIKWSQYTEYIGVATARDINDAIMRCLVKNIALFGIGLKLYSGEDLEQYYLQTPENPPKNPPKTVKAPQKDTPKVQGNKEKEVVVELNTKPFKPFDVNDRTKIIEQLLSKIEKSKDQMKTFANTMKNYGFTETDNFTLFSQDQLIDCATKYKIDINELLKGGKK